MPLIVTPKYISFTDWAATLFIDLPNLNIPVIHDESEWKDWGRRLIELNQLTTVPLPEYFDDWITWAEYFLGNIQTQNN